MFAIDKDTEVADYGMKTKITLTEACGELGCGKTKLHEFLRAGRLERAPSAGRETYVAVESVQRLLSELASNVDVGPAPRRARNPVPETGFKAALRNRVRDQDAQS